MSDDQSTDAAQTCPKCGEPCTLETPLGVRYCSNAHSWKAPDYPRVVSAGRARSEEGDTNG